MYLSETKSHLTTAHEITWKLIHLLVGWILYLYCFPVFFFLGCLLVFHVLLCPLVFVFHFCAFGFSFSFFFFQISALPFNTFLFFLINSCLLQKISLWLSEEEQQIHVREKYACIADILASASCAWWHSLDYLLQPRYISPFYLLIRGPLSCFSPDWLWWRKCHEPELINKLPIPTDDQGQYYSVAADKWSNYCTLCKKGL